MKESFKEYSKIVLKDYLRLQRGDALSVNAEECNLEEAKYLASEALSITGANVKIVTTVNGKPQEVIEFDAPDSLTTQVNGLAMVRLVNENNYSTDNPNEIDANNLPLIKKLGHLAEPLEVGRRIAVPWAVVNVNSKGPELNGNFDSIAKLTDEIRYRQSYLRHLDIHKVRITGDKCDFTFEVPEDVYFTGGLQTLSNGREFLTGDNFDLLSFTVDKNSAKGSFTAMTKIAGNTKEIHFEFKEGVLTSHTPDAVLDKILSLDQEICKIGLIRFRDKEIIVNLGGSDTNSLSSLPQTEDDIPQEFNTSLFTVMCSLGNNLNVVIYDCEGREKEIIRKGYFIE